MILYGENPDLKLKTVTTISGDTEYRRNCKYIGGKYYLMNKDCFCIDDKWYRVDGGNIIYDHELKIWVHKNRAEGLIRGVVDFDKDKQPILGYFSPNAYCNVRCKTQKLGNTKALNEEILLKNNFIEDVASCLWYYVPDLGGAATAKKAATIRNERGFTDRGYNIEDNIKDFNAKVALYNSYNTPISKTARQFAKYLGDITFGSEVEIHRGNMPDHLQNRTGIVICRDGSIDGGPELVTIPMSGAKGLQTIKSISEYLEPRGEVSIACAFHIHIGNIGTDRLFIAAFYQLCRKIQDELFTMFPYYKTDHRGVKRKNYNQKLQSLGIYPLAKTDKDSYDAYLSDTYTRIFDFLVEGKISIDQFNRKTREHPETRKWERHSRYFWSNLMNMFFTNRNTVEFRLHGPTTNHHKMINWLFICSAIVKYASKYSLEIITSQNNTIPLKEVFNIFKELHPKDTKATFLSDYIYNYFLERQAAFTKDLKRGDKLSQWDIDEDKSYTFTYKGVTGLV